MLAPILELSNSKTAYKYYYSKMVASENKFEQCTTYTLLQFLLSQAITLLLLQETVSAWQTFLGSIIALQYIF